MTAQQCVGCVHNEKHQWTIQKLNSQEKITPGTVFKGNQVLSVPFQTYTPRPPHPNQ